MTYLVYYKGALRANKEYKTYRGLSRHLNRLAREGRFERIMVSVNAPGFYDVIPVTFTKTETSCGWSAEPKGIPYGVALVQSTTHHNSNSPITKALSYGEQR